MRHFDVVFADFDRGVERRVGLVAKVSDESVIEKDVEARFVGLVGRVLHRVECLDADDALVEASRLLAGSRVSSTPVHDGRDCPFAAGDEIEMDQVHLGQGLLL